jgi:hypothetical protein
MKTAILLLLVFLYTNAIFNKERLTPKYKELFNKHSKDFKNIGVKQVKGSLFSTGSYNIHGEEEVKLSKASLESLLDMDISGFQTQLCNSSDTVYSNAHQVIDYATGMGPIRDSSGAPIEGFGTVVTGYNNIIATISFLKSLAKFQSQCLCGKAIVYADSLSKSNFGSSAYLSNTVSNRVGGWRGFVCAVIVPVKIFI